MIDAAELKQTMDKLSNVVPTLTPRFDTLVQQADTLKERAEALLEQFQEADVQGDGLFKDIHDAMQSLTGTIVTNREALLGALDQVETGIDELDEVEQAREALKQGGEAAGTAMEEFRARLEQGVEQAKQAGETFREALDEVKQQTEEGREALQSGLGAAQQAAETFQQHIVDGQQAVDHTIDDLADEIKKTQEAALEQLQGYLKTADELRETFTHGLEELMANVIQQPATELVEELQEKITNELKGLVDESTNELKDALGGLGEKVLGAKEGSSSGRDTIQPLFEKLDGFFDPIKNVIDGIRKAADTVGIDF
jgi:uncharacterized coiled-coil DUF342 family protein